MQLLLKLRIDLNWRISVRSGPERTNGLIEVPLTLPYNGGFSIGEILSLDGISSNVKQAESGLSAFSP